MFPRAGLAPILIVIAVAVAAVLGGGVWYLARTPSEGIACTMEAKLCPDGTAVGRTGPNCEFTACPTAISTAQSTSTRDATADWKIGRDEKYGFELRYPKELDAFGGDLYIIFAQSTTGRPENQVFALDLECRYGSDYGLEGADDVTSTIRQIQHGAMDFQEKKVWALRKLEKSLVSVMFRFDLPPRMYTSHPTYDCREGNFIFNGDPGQEIISGVLSSFKFIEPTASSKPEIKAIDISSWSAYINTKYLFGFKYPEGHIPYIAVDKESRIILPAGADASRIVLAEDEEQIFSGVPKTLAFDVIKEDVSIGDWLAGNLQKYIPSSHFISQKDIQFLGKGAVEVLGDGGDGSTYKLIVVKPGNFSIAIAQSAKSSFLDQVLGTFTFNVQSLR